jgi:hypothetical protein
MTELNLFAGVEAAEEGFYNEYISPLFEKWKAARRALLVLLMIREPLGQSEQAGEPFDALEQAYVELAAAVFANGRAAFLLIELGYLFPAKTLLRSLWEQVTFMEYFRLYQEEGRAWASATPKDKSARTPEPTQAWSAIRAKGGASILGGKRKQLYEYLTSYAHSHRAALFDLTTPMDEEMVATAFGPAHQPSDLDLVVQMLVILLVSAIEVLQRQFDDRLRVAQAQQVDSILRDIERMAGLA